MVGTVRSESTGDHLTHAVVQVHPIASDATAEGGQRKMLH
jgi:hypothetical protein